MLNMRPRDACSVLKSKELAPARLFTFDCAPDAECYETRSPNHKTVDHNKDLINRHEFSLVGEYNDGEIFEYRELACVRYKDGKIIALSIDNQSDTQFKADDEHIILEMQYIQGQTFDENMNSIYIEQLALMPVSSETDPREQTLEDLFQSKALATINMTLEQYRVVKLI